MIGSFAFTEPDHGSDWVLAAHALLILCVDASQGMQGTGIALIPLDLPGISRAKPLDKLGLRTYPQGALIFDEVKIPGKMMLIAETDAGFNTQQWILTPAGELLSAIATGLAQAAFDEALRYAKVRIQGGKPIIEHQSIGLKLFKMLTMIETARSYSRRVALHNAAQPPGSALHALSAKVHCTETAFEVASEDLQILGGYGLSREYPVEKMFRDARTGMIGEENNALSLAGIPYLKQSS
jgi:alkylation response protein AidB-like acyl-CoA dehydrogenase